MRAEAVCDRDPSEPFLWHAQSVKITVTGY